MSKTLGIVSILLNIICLGLIVVVLIDLKNIKIEIASIKNEASSTNIKLDYVVSDINRVQYKDSSEK